MYNCHPITFQAFAGSSWFLIGRCTASVLAALNQHKVRDRGLVYAFCSSHEGISKFVCLRVGLNSRFQPATVFLVAKLWKHWEMRAIELIKFPFLLWPPGSSERKLVRFN